MTRLAAALALGLLPCATACSWLGGTEAETAIAVLQQRCTDRGDDIIEAAESEAELERAERDLAELHTRCLAAIRAFELIDEVGRSHGASP